MKAPADCRARGPLAFDPGGLTITLVPYSWYCAEVAVDVVHQHQDDDRAPGQVAADLQAAVVDHPLRGVGVDREHRHVLSRLADLHRHGQHRAGDGVLRSSHPANLERVLDQLARSVYTSVGEFPDLLGVRGRHDHHRDARGLPGLDLLTHVVDVADDRGVVDQLVGDDLGRLVLAVGCGTAW